MREARSSGPWSAALEARNALRADQLTVLRSERVGDPDRAVRIARVVRRDVSDAIALEEVRIAGDLVPGTDVAVEVEVADDRQRR
jgi:hypothetical protein